MASDQRSCGGFIPPAPPGNELTVRRLRLRIGCGHNVSDECTGGKLRRLAVSS
jgi:hypothetical protein